MNERHWTERLCRAPSLRLSCFRARLPHRFRSSGAVTPAVRVVGSGVNGHRRKVTTFLSDPTVTVIVVEHFDRLFEHLHASMSACGRRIVVLDASETSDDETSDDVVRDVTEVLTLLCARLYGRRRAVDHTASRRAAKAVAVATSGQS